MYRIAAKILLHDGEQSVSRSFDKITHTVDDAFAKSFVKTLLPLYGGSSATYTVYNYSTGAVESD